MKAMERARLDDLMARIGDRVLRQDDLLRTAFAVRRNDDAVKELFDRLTQVCLEQLFFDLEFRHVVQEMSDDEYLLEVARLISQCRTVGLEPSVTIDQLDLDALDGRELGSYRPPE